MALHNDFWSTLVQHLSKAKARKNNWACVQKEGDCSVALILLYNYIWCIVQHAVSWSIMQTCTRLENGDSYLVIIEFMTFYQRPRLDSPVWSKWRRIQRSFRFFLFLSSVRRLNGERKKEREEGERLPFLIFVSVLLSREHDFGIFDRNMHEMEPTWVAHPPVFALVSLIER